jgi:feruloyl esterase
MNPASSALAHFLVAVVFLARAAAASTCEDLTALAIKNVTITSARLFAAGTVRPASGAPREVPASCRVAATLKPTSDSDIKMEIWMPVERWNSKFQANGNGGWSGFINPAALASGVQRGYAAAMTDTGHEGSSASFALGHPEKLIDFGYRSAHEVAVTAKAVIAAFYGRPPKLSYWVGCSAGGRQALMEAQRYPADFDGIVAGAPGLNWTGRALESIWVAQAVHRDEASYIVPGKYGIIHEAALRACDELDGLKDGVLENPERCKFDPRVLECQDADGPGCLSAAQVEAARKIYAKRRNPATKRLIVPGLEPGSELGWATMGGPQPLRIGLDLFRYVVFEDPDWNYHSFQFDADVERTETAERGLLNAVDANLKPFFERGGKLIQYHGWNDPQIPPGFSVEYFESVLQALGADRVAKSYRLFMVPGMAHCGGGEGTSSFDMLTALEQWVEKGNAPDRILASRIRGGAVDRTRPLCPYPQVAVYQGTGSTDDQANFACKP